MASFTYKPVSSGQVNSGGASVITGGNYSSAGIYDSTGKLVSQLNRGAVENGQTKFYTNQPGSSFGNNFTVGLTDAQGKVTHYKIGQGGSRYEGDDPNNLQQVTQPGTSGGGRFDPGHIGFGATPAYLGGEFPSPDVSDYTPINKAPYKFTDPMEFAAKYGDFNRQQIDANYDTANKIALKELDTELAGLNNYAPAAAALKRGQISLDNLFNQSERTSQVNSALPGVSGQLNAQTSRAEAYASGRAPDDITDRGLELGVRGAAADEAAAGGFGSNSSVARKASDLADYKTRIGLSQYGDNLLSKNINDKASLFLAPTEYSNAGSEIRSTPSVSGSQLAAAALADVNNASLITAQNAFSGTVQQQQYSTSLDQQTRQFNASNTLQNDQFNATNANNFALDKFSYDVGYAGTLAGAAQTNTNTNLALQQQAQAQKIFQGAEGQAQTNQTIGAVAGAVGAVGSVFKGLFSAQGNPDTAGDVNTPFDTSGSSGQFTPSQPSSSPDFSGSLDTSSGASSTLPFSTSFNDGGGGYTTGANTDVQSPQYLSPPTADLSQFTSDTGLSVGGGSQGGGDGGGGGDSGGGGIPAYDANNIAAVGGATLSMAGISTQPLAGTTNIGVNSSGQQTYANTALLKSPDATAGTATMGALRQALDPLGAFSNEDASAWDKTATVAGDVSLTASLTDAAARGDTKSFVNTALGAFKQPTIDALTKDPQNKAGLGAAFSAFQLSQNWNSMSPAQKSLGLASLGIQTYKYSNGVNLAQKSLIAPDLKSGTPGLNVGQALNLFSAGYNVYGLAKNWDQLNTLQKVAYGTGSAAQLAELSKQFGMLGAGTGNAAVAGVTQEGLSAAGWTPTLHSGVGAVTGQIGSQVPDGYSVVSQSGDTVIAAPTSNIISAQGATGPGSLLDTAAGVSGVALGAKQVYDNWGTGGKTGALNGALGGAAMVGGLVALGASNPYILAGIVAYSALGGSIKQSKGEQNTSLVATNPILGPQALIAEKALSLFGDGKSGDQQGRDQIRSVFQRAGLSNDNHDITLADGSKANIGIDGHGGSHSVTNPELLVNGQQSRSGAGKLNSWDTDYTNDLDYAAGMGGSTLSQLLNGGVGKPISQLGGQLGNAFLKNVGYGKSFTPENFNAVTANIRSAFAQSGIKSKADAYQLSNQGFAEGRFNATQLVTMQQAINMAFDKDGYSTAQKLMQGRFRGIEIAASGQAPPDTSNVHTLPLETNLPRAQIDSTLQKIAGRPQDVQGHLKGTPGGVYGDNNDLSKAEFQARFAPNIASARARNAARYSGVAA